MLAPGPASPPLAEPSRSRRGGDLKVRLRAFAIHVGLSLVIFFPLLYLITVHWYPGGYFLTDGGSRGIVIVFCVDVVLGPTLTLIIFDSRKSMSKIRFDLSVIATLQLGALIWGIYAVHSQRPIAAVYWDRALRPVIRASFEQQGIDVDEALASSEEKPALIYARPFDSKEDAAESYLRTFNDEIEPYAQVDRHEPLAGHVLTLREQQADIQKLRQTSPIFGQKLERFLAKHAKTTDELLFLTFRGRYDDAIFGFSEDGRLMGAITGYTEPR